jgi:hypothetical protein
MSINNIVNCKEIQCCILMKNYSQNLKLYILYLLNICHSSIISTYIGGR